MAIVRVAVIKNNLKYRIPGVREGKSFVPKIGDVIALPKEIALLELKTGNVRKLLPEEREAFKKKATKKKTKKKRDK